MAGAELISGANALPSGAMAGVLTHEAATAGQRNVTGASLRFRIDPRDVPASKAARRLGLTVAEFNRVRGDLFARGFPRPDPTTGNYDLKAIEAWQDARSGLASPLTEEPKPRDAANGFAERVARLANG
jgi:hypothetical protein